MPTSPWEEERRKVKNYDIAVTSGADTKEHGGLIGLSTDHISTGPPGLPSSIATGTFWLLS
ncbi:hypothetical protein N7489_004431 [Penicillium chrysogenum]|uniref:Uncharacterized protein n=1 Tax=Penicillium chrysogenum TaxID=5076 RepID=A0ABQ8WQJ3_PENCH|nr:uncharacterized protein N7489_004431 [Penicillium chrysogenum]KAJ5244335.1 hypothetical protein N7489_004431 [Penicillium chrysogenum]KAJ5275039.1 hypothetical protein N7505_003584 [Penicillium chrysogenum]KAJ5285529.1 hypothetical protein N7524_000835 [Penicillium chrysogenum]KAJ6156765.1 hypothetical protein N7497_005650 [Penicillium chrysogenum]